MAKIKPAATVVCIRETPQKEVEVLLLRRNTEVKFASGFWVFPGGKIEKEETSGEVDESAAKAAVIREAKEEANLELANNEMFFFCHWTTPPPSPKRFATWFFLTEVEHTQSTVTIDDSEIKDHIWLSPNDAIKGLDTKQIILMPPTFLVIQRIRNCRNFAEVKTELMRSAPLIVEPRVGMIDGVFQSMYPGDAGYDTHNVLAKGSRHRLVGNMKKGTYGFEYHGCEEHFPLHGGHDW